MNELDFGENPSSPPPLKLVDVAVPYRVASSFHYRIPETVEGLQIGSVVKVPFGRKSTHAFVMGFPESTDIDQTRLKDLQELLLPEPLFDESSLEFLKWVSDYYCHPIGEVMAAALPKKCWKLSDRQRARARKLAADDEFQSKLGISSVPASASPQLTEEQDAAVKTILKETGTVLLHGVTGSGKTEVYMSALEHFASQGKGAIILVPEIALTPQLLGRFASRFPGKLAVLHSDLTVREKYVQWERIRSGLATIVIGPRSAVFAPVKDLGLIVVDEEHETSYKQEDSLRYHARDVAVLRGKFLGATVVLGSATPSVESYWNAGQGKYRYARLEKRVLDRPMPKMHFVDIKPKSNWVDADHPWLSRELVNKIGAVIAEGQQALLYLNRLGFAHFLFCRDCGYTWRSRSCDVAMTYYRNPPMLKCHYSGEILPVPKVCSECAGINLEAVGLGTEKVALQLEELFPKARVVRMDRGVIKGRKDLENVLDTIRNGEADIIIGTQMIAKGHDFPSIALVGILLADSSLNMPDFRSFERTYQIITQVSGRAGRAEVPGEVVIQTLNPEHPVLHYVNSRAEDFYRAEMETRRIHGYPPFRRLALLRMQHRNAGRVESFSGEVATNIRHWIEKFKWDCEIFGPTEAPISKINHLYRWQMLLKSGSVRELQQLVKTLWEFAEYSKTPVQLSVDIDPVSTF